MQTQVLSDIPTEALIEELHRRYFDSELSDHLYCDERDIIVDGCRAIAGHYESLFQFERDVDDGKA